MGFANENVLGLEKYLEFANRIVLELKIFLGFANEKVLGLKIFLGFTKDFAWGFLILEFTNFGVSYPSSLMRIFFNSLRDFNFNIILPRNSKLYL